MTAAARKTITRANKAAATSEVVNLGPWKFPKRSDFIFDFPKRSDFGLAALDATKGNAEGVSKSWANASTRIARMTKHGVKVTDGGKSIEFKSVAAAFRELRLPFEKHIKFRLSLKQSQTGKETFVHNDRMYMFELTGFEEVGESIKI